MVTFVTDTFPTICFLICIYSAPAPVVVDSFAQECRIIRPSRNDTADTLRQVGLENERCRTAKARAQTK